MDKKNSKNPSSDPTSALQITAKSWAILNANTGELVYGFHEHDRKEIASLTKIMTAYTSIQIITKLDINILASKVETSFDAALMNGTSADLAEGDVLSIWDMLHAMLLPSGNDAAYALAEYFGLLLLELGMPSVSKVTDPIQIFIAEMNKNAKSLGLSDTNYANPHGLQNCFNKSSAYDIAKLSAAAMKSPLFAEIVKKAKYTCLGQDMFGNQKMFMWYNTNKLLAKGFNGLKTGITPTAGPCLSSSYKDSQISLIMVVLNCKSPEHRWNEIMRMKDWASQTLLGRKEKEKSENSTNGAQTQQQKIDYSKKKYGKPPTVGKVMS